MKKLQLLLIPFLILGLMACSDKSSQKVKEEDAVDKEFLDDVVYRLSREDSHFNEAKRSKWEMNRLSNKKGFIPFDCPTYQVHIELDK